MKKILSAVALLALLASAVWADTLYLKNGSVLKGTFIGFENGEFVFEVTGGNRLKIRPAEVSRLVMERNAPAPAPAPPVAPSRDPRNKGYPSRNPGGNTTNNNPGNSDARPGPAGGRWENLPPFDVALENQWLRSQIRVERGQRVRVDASGTIYLEGRTAVTPDGLSRRDREAPMPDQNDGALIAAVGQEQDSPPIFIGRSREFTADRAGILYFTVNHWETRDARGSFRVNVAVEGGATVTGGGNLGGGTSSPSNGRPPQGRTKTITVYADQAWTDTGIDLDPNTTVEITAEGQIRLGNRRNIGPEGDTGGSANAGRYPVPNAGVGALIGKIRYRDGRDSNFIFVGPRGTPATEPGEYGRLFLGINDDNFRDNGGSFRVTIRY